MDVCRLQIPSFDSQKKVLCQGLLLLISKNECRESWRWLPHICTEHTFNTLTGQPQQSIPTGKVCCSHLQRGWLPEPDSACSCTGGKTEPHQLFPVKRSLGLAGVNKHQVCTLFRNDLNKGLYFLSSSDKQKTIPNFSIPATEHNFL